MFQGSLAVATQMLMSEEAYAVPGLRAALGRLANSVVAVLGPELSPGTDVYTKCKALIREVQVGLHSIRLLSWQSMVACCSFPNAKHDYKIYCYAKLFSIPKCLYFYRNVHPTVEIKLRNTFGEEKRVSTLGRCSRRSSMAKSQLSD